MWSPKRKKLEMPSPGDALPGRATRMKVPSAHFVNGHRLDWSIYLSFLGVVVVLCTPRDKTTFIRFTSRNHWPRPSKVSIKVTVLSLSF